MNFNNSNISVMEFIDDEEYANAELERAKELNKIRCRNYYLTHKDQINEYRRKRRELLKNA